MRILLTGSTGFIGSYFLENYSSKYDIKSFSFRNDNFQQLELNGIDTIIHLSALVHQMGGATQEEYDKINVQQTLDLAKKAKKNGVKHFIFMSTVKIYGEETEIPYTENSECLPQDDYGKSKLEAEQVLQELSDDNFIVSIIRTPIVYGKGVKANIQNLIKLVQKIPILPLGKIKNKRSMVYIGNLCHLLDVLIKKQIKGVFLVSDDTPVSTTKLIELIVNALDKKLYLIKVPFFRLILKKLKPSVYSRLFESLEIDNKHTRELLNYKNKFSIEDGIKRMCSKK